MLGWYFLACMVKIEKMSGGHQNDYLRELYNLFNMLLIQFFSKGIQIMHESQPVVVSSTNI